MEDDNNKRRKAARREFQENVRALVAFVRKRDVRVIAWTEHEDRKKAEREAAEKRRWVPLKCRLHAASGASSLFLLMAWSCIWVPYCRKHLGGQDCHSLLSCV